MDPLLENAITSNDPADMARWPQMIRAQRKLAQWVRLLREKARALYHRWTATSFAPPEQEDVMVVLESLVDMKTLMRGLDWEKNNADVEWCLRRASVDEIQAIYDSLLDEPDAWDYKRRVALAEYIRSYLEHHVLSESLPVVGPTAAHARHRI